MNIYEKLKEYYPAESYLISEETDKKFIKSELMSKSVTNWGQSEIGDTGYFLLASTSPAHYGSKQTIFVCKSELAKKYLDELNNDLDNITNL